MPKVWDGIPLGRAVVIGHPYISHHKSRIKISPKHAVVSLFKIIYITSPLFGVEDRLKLSLLPIV